MAVPSRIESLKYLGMSSGMFVASTIGGVVATTCDLVSLGQNRWLHKQAKQMQEFVGASSYVISHSMIKVINPKGVVEEWTLPSTDLAKGRIKAKNLPSHLQGITVKQQDIVDRLYLNGNFFERQIETRLFGLISGVALAVAGIALTIFGAVSTLAAMVTLGCFEKVNSYAANNVATVGFAINQLHLGVLGAVVPSKLASDMGYRSHKNYPLYRSAVWLAAGATGVAAYRLVRA